MMKSCWLSLSVLLTSLLSITVVEAQDDACFTTLFASDANGSGRLSQREYVNFVEATSPNGLLEDVDSYNDLPLVIRSTFIALSCFCPQETSCCTGSSPFIALYDVFDSSVTDEESDYMQSICRVSERAIQQYIQQEEFPTESPTRETSRPTDSPTANPTSKSPTFSPTPEVTDSSPTIEPTTGEPSPSPSRLDTDPPTNGPTTGAPTESPSEMASGVPTVSPSASPSIADSGVPTVSPSATPSVADSVVPTVSPSATPSITDSGVPTLSPSATPSTADSGVPTLSPSESPSIADSGVPTSPPTVNPFLGDSRFPTLTPSLLPSMQASDLPTSSPSTLPSVALSISPTLLPSATPSIADSGVPTLLPSTMPSTVPSITDSGIPTLSPSTLPSTTPSIQGSQVPSTLPSSVPSSTPTTPFPSSTPTIQESLLPSNEPTTAMPSSIPTTTIAPSAVPSNIPTPLPSILPSTQPTTTPNPTDFPTISAAPTVIPIFDIDVGYTIVAPTNVTSQEYIFDLIAAMDVVASETAKQVESSSSTRRRKLRYSSSIRRRLAVRVRFPTRIIELENVTASEELECPNDLDEETQQCQRVNALVLLVVTEEHNNDETIAAFRQALSDNIQDGALIEALALINPSSPITINTGSGSGGGGSRGIQSDPALSVGGIIGIILAALVICIGSVILQRRTTQQRQEDMQQRYASHIQPVESRDLPQESESDSSEQGYAMPFLQFQQSGETQTVLPAGAAGTAGAVASSKKSPPSKREAGDDNASAADVSYENSSGWSDNLSASMGSIETGDLDSPSYKVAGSPPSAISGDQSVSKRLDDLELALSTGDWSMVGASAALLAASQQDTTDDPPRSNATSLLRGNMEAPHMDEATAAELEEMIKIGDWEGVIQTAAKMEATKPQNVSMDSDEEDAGGSSNSQTSSGASMQGYSEGGSEKSGGSDFYVGQAQISDKDPDEEIKKEVIDLVAKVVPEELDNIDEMIGQFKGREHELLETLRTMQERDIALKAKRAAQQQTKLELGGEDKDEKLRRKMETIEAAANRSQGSIIHDDNDDDSASL